MGLFDYYTKAKKKVSDTIDSVESAASSSLGAVANSFKSGLKATEDYFKPTEQVRVRDVVREAPAAVAKVGRSMFEGTEHFVKDAGNAFGTGLAYWNPGKIYGDYKKEDVPMNDLPTPTRMLANTGRSILEAGTFGKAPKWAASPNVIKRTAQGAGIGYGFDVLGNVADSGKVEKKSFKPGMNTVMGGVFGAAAKPTAEMAQSGIDATKKEAQSIVSDVRQGIDIIKAPKAKKVVPVYEDHPVALIDGKPTQSVVPGKMAVEEVKKKFAPKSATFQFMQKPKAGMSIVAVKPDASGSYPVGSFSARFDKKPRIEINDSGAVLNAKKRNFFYETSDGKPVQKLSDILSHEELFAKYPEARNITITQRHGSLNGIGDVASYDPERNEIAINTKNILDENDLKSTILHEVQHAIQRKEGFARGGSPIEFERGLARQRGAIEGQIRDLNERMSRAVGTPEYGDLMDKRMELVEELQRLGLDDPIGIKERAHGSYKRLGGELESRSVQRRMGLTPEQRLASDPYAEEAKATGINSVDDVITRFSDGVSASSSGRPPLIPTNKNTQAINTINAEKNAKARAAVERMKSKQGSVLNPQSTSVQLMPPKVSQESNLPTNKSLLEEAMKYGSVEDFLKNMDSVSVKNLEAREVPREYYINRIARDSYEKDLKPRKVSVGGRDYTQRSAEIEAKKVGGRVEPSEFNSGRFSVVKEVAGDAEGKTFDEYFEKYRKDFESVYRSNTNGGREGFTMQQLVESYDKTKATADPLEAFKKSLDEIPTPWSDVPKNNIEKDLAKMREKDVLGYAADTLFGNQTFNKYQERAYKQKQERIKAIRSVINVDQSNVLRAMGYNKREVGRLGIDEANQIAELGKLGYSKRDLERMDFDRRRLVLENKVPAQTLKEYDRRKHALDTNFLDGINPDGLRDISPLQAGTRDVYRNFEDAFGANYQKIKKELLDPFDEAKGAFIGEQNQMLKELDDAIVKGLGIKKGSRESAAVQRYGDADLPEGERMSYDDLVKEFGKEKADKIVTADSWFRQTYDRTIDELNHIREYYFPTHPLYPESSKIIPKRANYYRHFREMADGFSGLLNIFDSPANIDPSLAVSSEFTKPSTKWLSFAQQRKGQQTDLDAVGGFLDYLKANAYAKHIDPHIQRFRGVDAELKSKTPQGEYFDNTRVGLAEELSRKMDPVRLIADSTDTGKIKNMLIERGLQDRDALRMAKDLVGIKDAGKVREYLAANLTSEGMASFNPKAAAEDSQNKLNNFLKFLDNFANDLAGKTNPLDRPIQDNFIGRQAFRAINWLNSRVKANVILGNASSAMAQFFGIPNGIANAGIRNSIPAIGDSLLGIVKDDTPISRSNFISERYFDGYDKFDPGIINNAKRFAVWLTSVGDRIGTTFNWNAQYRKALSEGVSDPVKYADDWTRKMVAGRGIGEVPIMQKSKFIQLVAPFQLEVANQWRVFSDWAKNDPRKLVLAKRLIEYSIATYLMNRVAEELRGSDVAFDPLNAMTDAYDSYMEASGPGEGTLLAGGRLAGEFLSNIPGGQQVAEVYPEYGMTVFGEKLPTREKLFGDKDPTRFGGGILATRALTDPLYMLIPPFGGRQIKNTIEGAGTLMQGYAETDSGKVMTPVDRTVPNIMKGAVFGKNAIDEVQTYRENDQTPLSEDQTEKFKIGGREYYDSVMASRESDREKDRLKAAAASGKPMGDAGNIGEGIHRLKDGTYYVPGLTSDQKTFKTEKLARMAIAKEDFENSDGNFRDLGEYVLRKRDDGTAYPQRKDVFTSSLLTAKMSGAKKSDNLEEWTKLADQKFELLNRLVQDPTVDELDRAGFENQIQTLVDEYAKYRAYGGFRKGRASKEPKVEEKYRYGSLVDPTFLRIETSVLGANRKPMIAKRMPQLVQRRIPTVRRRKRR
jgi:hypothetical protein